MTSVHTVVRSVAVRVLQSGYGRVVLASLGLLLLPWLAMGLTDQMQWDWFDFLVFGLMLLSAGSLFVWLSRRFPSRQLWLAGAVLLLFIYCWAELAVGIFFHFGS